MNKDQVKGTATEATGAIKEVAGKAIGNSSTEAEGAAEKILGKTQAAYGDTKDAIDKKR